MTTFYCDGGVYPGLGIYWSVAVQTEHELTLLTQKRTTAKYHTNNEAEYIALCDALRAAVNYEGPIRICSDSQLIVRQMEGKYKVKEARLQQLHEIAKRMLATLTEGGFTVTVEWVPREEIVPRLGH